MDKKPKKESLIKKILTQLKEGTDNKFCLKDLDQLLAQSETLNELCETLLAADRNDVKVAALRDTLDVARNNLYGARKYREEAETVQKDINKNPHIKEDIRNGRETLVLCDAEDAQDLIDYSRTNHKAALQLAAAIDSGYAHESAHGLG